MGQVQYTYRLPPCPRYDIAGTESWLEDMAARGYILVKDGFLFDVATFEKGPAQAIRYRLEATDTNGGLFSDHYDPEAEAVTLNHLMGWTYIARRGQFHIYACTDSSAPEMHTDPKIQAMSLNSVTKFLRGNLCQTLVMAAFYLLAYFSDTIFSFLVYFGLGISLLLAGFLASFLVAGIVNLLSMARLRRALQCGKPLNHRRDYRRSSHGYFALRGLRVIVGIFLFFSIATTLSSGLTGENAVALEQSTASFPFATGETLYPEASAVQYNSYFSDNAYTSWSHWIAPENYDYQEYCELTLPNGRTRTADITIDYHRCRFEWIAQCLASEFVAQARGSIFDRIFDDPPQIIPIQGLDADYAVTYSVIHGYPTVVLCQGSTVIRARFGNDISENFTAQELAQLLLDTLK